MDAAESVFTDQSPDDLFLSVVRGKIDASQVHVVSTVTAEFAGMAVEARVIGASHLISVTTPCGSFHEMLACAHPSLEDNYSLSRTRIGALPISRLSSSCSLFRHDFSSVRLDWADGEPQQLQRLERMAKSARGSTFGVSFDFPQGDLPAVPKTVIFGHIDHERLRVSFETAHSYPGVAVVMSKTSVVPLQEGAS